MDMMSDFENLDVMLGNEKINPIERELADAIDQSSAHGDAATNVYQRNENRDYLHEIDSLRQIKLDSPSKFSQMNATLDCLKKWTQ